MFENYKQVIENSPFGKMFSSSCNSSLEGHNNCLGEALVAFSEYSKLCLINVVHAFCWE